MQLRPYQIEDVEKLKPLDACGIFNEQRTGKTPTSLKLLEAKNCRKILIVCPASLMYQWKDEFERWLDRPCTLIVGTAKARLKAISEWTDGAVISYDGLKATKTKEGHSVDIMKVNPEAIVIDEAHRIKNIQSATARGVFGLIKIPVRLALTGTPAPNKPHEIFNILKFLRPEEYTSYYKFVQEYCIIRKLPNGRGGFFNDITGLKPTMARVLQNSINRFCIQRKRKEVMPWLSDKIYINIKLEKTREQNKYLKELKEMFETEHIITMGVLDRLIRYRQICLAPELLELKGKSPKMDWIVESLKDFPETPTLIFSKFTSFIHILQKNLVTNGIPCDIIVGATPKEKRKQIVDSFQNGKLNILLINIDAGKEGLTLDRADRTIFTDVYPPLADIMQAEDRFVATTEERKNKGNEVIRLMIKDSYDEKLYELINQRLTEVDVLNDYKKYLTGGY